MLEIFMLEIYMYPYTSIIDMHIDSNVFCTCNSGTMMYQENSSDII